MRGEDYLLDREGDPAAREFQKTLDHPGLVLNFPLDALGYRELGKAPAIVHDQTGARRAFEEFLTLWKDAASDIPVLREVKTELARMQSLHILDGSHSLEMRQPGLAATSTANAAPNKLLIAAQSVAPPEILPHFTVNCRPFGHS